jgi:hypothetical protein
MKKIIILCAAVVVIMSIYSCTKLDVPVESQYVKSNFPVTDADYIALTGTIYANLSSNYAVPYWRMQELSTDEAILPARDGNFDDGGQYRQLHYHSWTFDGVLEVSTPVTVSSALLTVAHHLRQKKQPQLQRLGPCVRFIPTL